MYEYPPDEALLVEAAAAEAVPLAAAGFETNSKPDQIPLARGTQGAAKDDCETE
jgi:hypothetical protein